MSSYLKLLLIISCSLVISCQQESPSWKLNSQAEGTIDGAGGGDFVRSEFWYFADLVKDRIQQTSSSNPLNQAQIDKLVLLMSEKQTHLKLTEEILYETLASGKKQKVIALNYPKDRSIQLSLPNWKEKLENKKEVRHLILHEFLGLAKISDVNYSISLKYYKAYETPLLYSASGVRCYTHSTAFDLSNIKKNKFRTYPDYNIKNSRLIDVYFPFSKEKFSQDFQCNLKKCPEALYKEVQGTLNFEYNKDFLVQFQVFIYKQRRIYGWGAAAGSYSVIPAHTEIFAQLVATTEHSKKEVLDTSTKSLNKFELRETSLGKELSIGFSLYNSKFYDLLHQFGIKLNRHKTLHPGLSPYKNTNLEKKLRDWSKNYTSPRLNELSPLELMFKSFPQQFISSSRLECRFVRDSPAPSISDFEPGKPTSKK